MEIWIALIASSVLATALAVAGVAWLMRRPRRPDPQTESVRRWVALQLSELPPAQKEAVELFAWAAKSGWPVVAHNVNLGSDFPNAKKAIQHD